MTRNTTGMYVLICVAGLLASVTALVQTGQNTVQVEVIGTPKNTLGPHHGNPGLGTAWPSMFQKGPQTGPPSGDAYHTVAYGLFEPFVFSQILPQ